MPGLQALLALLLRRAARRRARAARALEAITVSPAWMAAAMTGGSCIFVLYRKGGPACRETPRRPNWPITSPQRELHPGDMPIRRSGHSVYTHCMRRIAALLLLCVFGALLPSATVVALAAPQQLLPICCRAHGAHACMMGKQPPRPRKQDLCCANPDAHLGRASEPSPRLPSPQISPRAPASLLLSPTLIGSGIADAVATRILRRSAPRGPPSPFSV